MLQGLALEWHTNGILKRATRYVDGQIDGVEEFYDQKLTLLRRVQWRQGDAVSDLHFLCKAQRHNLSQLRHNAFTLARRCKLTTGRLCSRVFKL